jgi:hypothetical protein
VLALQAAALLHRLRVRERERVDAPQPGHRVLRLVLDARDPLRDGRDLLVGVGERLAGGGEDRLVAHAHDLRREGVDDHGRRRPVGVGHRELEHPGGPDRLDLHRLGENRRVPDHALLRQHPVDHLAAGGQGQRRVRERRRLLTVPGVGRADHDARRREEAVLLRADHRHRDTHPEQHHQDDEHPVAPEDALR